MKRILALIIVCSFISCEKSEYCADTIKGKPDTNLISESDLNTVVSLFNTNNLNPGNFFVYRLNQTITGYHVCCHQYVNNLQVFSEDVVFHFNVQNQYSSRTGEIISRIGISSDPEMSKREAVKVFLNLVDEDGHFTSNSLKDKCFQCEIGYYDLNAGSGNDIHNFKLAWKIRLEDSEYPFAYINDTDKSSIYFDNGRRY